MVEQDGINVPIALSALRDGEPRSQQSHKDRLGLRSAKTVNNVQKELPYYIAIDRVC